MFLHVDKELLNSRPHRCQLKQTIKMSFIYFNDMLNTFSLLITSTDVDHCRLTSAQSLYHRHRQRGNLVHPHHGLTPNSRSVFCAGVSLNIHSFIHSISWAARFSHFNMNNTRNSFQSICKRALCLFKTHRSCRTKPILAL